MRENCIASTVFQQVNQTAHSGWQQISRKYQSRDTQNINLTVHVGVFLASVLQAGTSTIGGTPPVEATV